MTQQQRREMAWGKCETVQNWIGASRVLQTGSEVILLA